MSAGRPQERADLRRLARELAREAGQVLLAHRAAVAGDVAVAGTKTSGTDVVTAADVAAERHLRERLAALRPADGLLGEEGSRSAGTSGLTWVVDPLDGTVNYLYGTGTYAVSVAVVSGPPEPARWTVLAGAVHDVERDETYSAALGDGADLDGLRVRASGCDDVRRCLLGTGFSYKPEVRAEQGAVIGWLLPRVRDVRRIGSAALDLCMVASGRLDAYLERGLNPWDHAAAGLVVTEAGGRLRGPGGGPPARELTVAAAPGVADALDALLQEAEAATGSPVAGPV